MDGFRKSDQVPRQSVQDLRDSFVILGVTSDPSWHKMLVTRDCFNRGVEHELSLIWGPVQNPILRFR